MDRKGRGRRVDDLMFDLPLSCIDGRHASCVVAAPGGNAGELAVLLAATERVLGRELDPGPVFDAYLARFGRFYLHSDTPAAGRWVLAAAAELGVGAPVPLERAPLETFLRHPPVSWRAALLAQVTTPEHIGCGHLAAMVRGPERYRVRRELTDGVVRAFFAAMWRDEPDATFVLLDGAHDERAVVIFESPDLVDPTTSLSPSCPDRFAHQAFVYHAAAVRFTRRRAARWMIEREVGRRVPDTALVQTLMRAEADLGDHQLALTLEALAPTLPRWIVDAEGELLAG